MSFPNVYDIDTHPMYHNTPLHKTIHAGKVVGESTFARIHAGPVIALARTQENIIEELFYQYFAKIFGGIHVGANTCHACICTQREYRKMLLANYLCIGFVPGDTSADESWSGSLEHSKRTAIFKINWVHCKRRGPELGTSDFQSEVGEVFGEIGGELPAKFGRRFSSFFCWENRQKHIPPKLHREFHHQTSLRGSGLWRALQNSPHFL